MSARDQNAVLAPPILDLLRRIVREERELHAPNQPERRLVHMVPAAVRHRLSEKLIATILLWADGRLHLQPLVVVPRLCLIAVWMSDLLVGGQ